MVIREIDENDFNGLSALYMHLHSNKPIENNDENIAIFNEYCIIKCTL